MIPEGRIPDDQLLEIGSLLFEGDDGRPGQSRPASIGDGALDGDGFALSVQFRCTHPTEQEAPRGEKNRAACHPLHRFREPFRTASMNFAQATGLKMFIGGSCPA